MRPALFLCPGLISLLFLLSGLTLISGCNKALCASDVSKCLLQGLCQCRPSEGNCSCCKECMLCLSSLWEECCDCVGMCNPRNYNDSPASSKSTVEELYRPIPSLFRALTEGDAPINMMVVSFPVAEELSHHENLVSFLETLDSQSHNISLPSSSVHDGAYREEKILKHDFILSQNTCNRANETRDVQIHLQALLDRDIVHNTGRVETPANRYGTGKTQEYSKDKT
uniref:Twisted gastrulation protein homolog 1-A-like n=1 Tax=Sinocyclocheilus anshuiensis TaxID=1608454 RepID=A0A671NI08_9TELE